jgi:hypothetical protein
LIAPRTKSGLLHRSTRLYSITSSARVNNAAGTPMPSSLAVLRLTPRTSAPGSLFGEPFPDWLSARSGHVATALPSTVINARRFVEPPLRSTGAA